MVVIELKTVIAAPPERVFDLSRSIDLHAQSMERSREEAVGGRTSGLIGLGETVTWRARHLGVRQRLTARISGYERSRWFRDELVRGAFATMVHDHHFAALDGGTEMRDVFCFSAPAGPLGRLVERLVMQRYMTCLLAHRNAAIKVAAEGDEWRKLLGDNAQTECARRAQEAIGRLGMTATGQTLRDGVTLCRLDVADESPETEESR